MFQTRPLQDWPNDPRLTYLQRGPLVLQRLVDDLGGTKRAARAMGCARSTLDRWLQPGSLFVEISPSWPLYPSALHLLDVLAPVIGAHSYLHALVLEEWSVERVQREGLSLEALSLTPGAARKRGIEAKIPRTTLRRTLRNLDYPQTWHDLDRVVQATWGWDSWLSAVFGQSLVLPKTPSDEALGCLLEEWLFDVSLFRDPR